MKCHRNTVFVMGIINNYGISVLFIYTHAPRNNRCTDTFNDLFRRNPSHICNRSCRNCISDIKHARNFDLRTHRISRCYKIKTACKSFFFNIARIEIGLRI